MTSRITTWFLMHAAGAGPGSLKPLAALLASDDCVVERPPISGSGPPSSALDTAVEALVEALRPHGSSARVFGHSMGGLVAVAAVLRGARPGELVLYEPIVHAALDPKDRGDADALKPDLAMHQRSRAALAAGDLAGAAEAFVDSMGAGTWANLSREAQTQLSAQAPELSALAEAVSKFPVDLEALAETAPRIQILRGTRSPIFTRTIAQRVSEVLPQATLIDVEHAHHMSPVVHADRIAPFLLRATETSIDTVRQ